VQWEVANIAHILPSRHLRPPVFEYPVAGLVDLALPDDGYTGLFSR
jgi:hypothetical protein